MSSFCTKAYCQFSLLTLWLCNFLVKEIGVKAARQMLVKLPPDLDSKIIKVRPPGSVNLGISLRHIERLPSPFTSKCTSEYPADYQLANFDYSEALCQAQCKSLFINTTCGCWHPYRVPAQVIISAIGMFQRMYYKYILTIHLYRF